MVELKHPGSMAEDSITIFKSGQTPLNINGITPQEFL